MVSLDGLLLKVFSYWALVVARCRGETHEQALCFLKVPSLQWNEEVIENDKKEANLLFA